MTPTLILSRTHPTNDPDPVTNPQPKPKPAVWTYVAAGLAVGCAISVAGLVLMFGAGVLGMVGTR